MPRGFDKLQGSDLAKLWHFCTGGFRQTPVFAGRNESGLCKSREVLPRKTCLRTGGKTPGEGVGWRGSGTSRLASGDAWEVLSVLGL